MNQRLDNWKRAYRGLELTLRNRHRWHSIAIHDDPITSLPPAILLPLVAGHLKGKVRHSSELEVVLVHNLPQDTIAEKSLRFLGVRDFTVLRPKGVTKWRHALKLVELEKFLENCRKRYILYVDSTDVVLRTDPTFAIRCLEANQCDLLMSSTTSKRAYKWMPEVHRQTDEIAARHGFQGLYPNAGVFAGTRDFLSEIVADAMQYVYEDDLTETKHIQDFPNFPHRVGSDQKILRYLFPKYYPRMKVDYENCLAIRNPAVSTPTEEHRIHDPKSLR